MKSPKAILIDGNSLAYRAFYALPDTMKNSEGITTNAIYGFTSMILKLIEEKPDYIAVAFDRKEPTFRHIKFKEYKATRQKAPPTLYEQFPFLKELLKTLNVPVFELAGFEADDLIGTLAKKAEKQGYEVEIVSGDLDALQLVNKNIHVLTTRKGISDTVIYDEKGVEQRYGLRPDQILDFKALKGDTSDNIPGITGIGEKTATELLKQYGTLDNIFSHVDEIKKPKLKELLTTQKDQAELSKHLAQIVIDAPLNADISNNIAPDWENTLKFFERMEFKQFINKLREKQNISLFDTVEKKQKEITNLDYKLISTEEELKELCKQLENSKSFAFDTETDNLDPYKANLIGISISIEEGKAYYIPLGHKDGANLSTPRCLETLKPLFHSQTITKIGHNLKYDIEVLAKYDIKVCAPLFDTMVAAYLLDPTSSRYGLKPLAKTFLNRHEMISFDELSIDKDKDFSNVEVNLAKDYACSDADATFALSEIFEKLLKKENMDKLFFDVEMPLLSVLIDMEETGVYVDTNTLKKLSREIEITIKDLERNIFAIAGETFNLNSPKQLAVILFEKLQLPVIKRTKTGISTDAEVLDELSGKFEIAEKLLEYRSLTKLKSTYIDNLPDLISPDTGRIHTSFNQTITATGRLSSSNPNLQNIPIKSDLGIKIREAFVPQNSGYKILSADYSQIELRILAHLSEDKKLIEAFKLDEDIHTATAAEIFNVPLDQVTKEMRSQAKTVNFGIIYGISDFGLAKSLKIKRTEAAQFIQRYFEKYPGVKKFMDETIEKAKKDGYVTTLLGRKRPLPDINSPNHSLRGFAERTAINTPVQGTAADMIKIAMIKTYNASRITHPASSMIMQVHDELVFEVTDKDVDMLKQIVIHEMQNAMKLLVPVKVDLAVGLSWAG